MMTKKSLLLPHCFQTTGWWLLAISLVMLGVTLALDMNGNAQGTAFAVLAIAGTCLPTLSLLLICVSKERHEDEYVAYLRTRSVLWVVAFAFVVGMIEQSTDYMSVRYLTMQQLGRQHFLMALLTNPALLAVVYLVLFKGALFINKVKISKDE